MWRIFFLVFINLAAVCLGQTCVITVQVAISPVIGFDQCNTTIHCSYTLAVPDDCTGVYVEWCEFIDPACEVILQAEDGDIFFQPGDSRFGIVNETSLTISPTQLADSAVYICKIRADGVGATEDSVELVVDEGETPMVNAINAEPPNPINEGDQVTLTCNASGDPSPSYHWHFDASPLPEGSGYNLNEDGSALTIINSDRNDEGTYECSAVNCKGSTSDEFHLSVYFPPEDLSIDCHFESNVFHLNCSCNDANPKDLSYQWEFCDDSEYTTQYITINDRTCGDVIICEISNDAGSDRHEIDLTSCQGYSSALQTWVIIIIVIVVIIVIGGLVVGVFVCLKVKPFRVDKPPTPSNIIVLKVSCNFVNITWEIEEFPKELEFIVAVRETCDLMYDLTRVTPTPPYKIEGLEPNTSYLVYIKSKCGDNFSEPSATLRCKTHDTKGSDSDMTILRKESEVRDKELPYGQVDIQLDTEVKGRGRMLPPIERPETLNQLS